MTTAPWIVVLAGGEGKRLHSLTRALYGVDLPKQFAVLAGDRTLLQQTIERALRLTVPERVLVVISTAREAIAREQLAPYGALELVVQPHNLDTGPGLLLPLIRIFAREPSGYVAVLPSDHFIANEAPIVTALDRRPDVLTLLGVQPTQPDPEYGYIVRGSRYGRAHAIARFVEKPELELATQLVADGALWNTFISTGPVATYWELARRFLPQHAARFEHYAIAIGSLGEPSALECAYRGMTAANFSSDILARAPGLAVDAVEGSGWSDWGSPRRVFEALAGTPDHDRLLARIRLPFAQAS